MPQPALAALLVAAGMAGVEPSLVEVPAVAGLSREAPAKEVLRLTFDEVRRDQRRARLYYEAGRSRVGITAAFGPDPDLLWFEFDQDRRTVAHPRSALESGVRARFPRESYDLLYQNGIVRVLPLYTRPEPQANVSAAQLIRGLHTAAMRVLFQVVEYAVIVQEGPAPASVSLLREDYQGRLWVTHKSLDELSAIHWFVSVNGTRYGMSVEGRELVFHARRADAGFGTSGEVSLEAFLP